MEEEKKQEKGPSPVMLGVTVFACLFMVFSYGIALFGFLFPAPMVGLMDNMGLERAALMFSERRFAARPSDDNLMDVLDRNIDAQNWGRIITLTEELLERKDDVRSVALEQTSGTVQIYYVRALLEKGRYRGEMGAEGVVYDIIREPRIDRPAFVVLLVYGTDAATPKLRDAFMGVYWGSFEAQVKVEQDNDLRELGEWFMSEVERGMRSWIL